MRINQISAFALALIAVCSLAAPSSAKEAQAPQAAAPSTAQPALLSIGAGAFGVLSGFPGDRAADFRLEYRSGISLLPADLSKSFALRPFGGIEVTSDRAFYGLSGVVLDMTMGEHFVLSPSIGAGLFAKGGGKDMGHNVEFRSTMEVGYRMSDESRVTAAFGHISNAGFGNKNPGAEITTIYYQVPLNRLF